MENANAIVATKQATVPADINYVETAQRFLATVGQNCPAHKVQEFIEIAKLKKLNPFAREIYIVGYGNNWNVITGYEVYLKRAERMQFYDGFEFNIDSSNPNDISGTITIYRKDRNHPFKHTVFMNEVIGIKKDGGVNSMWQKMPRFMLKKVAIAQGFRLCFPLEFGDMPYISDEIIHEEKIEAPVLKTAPAPVIAPVQNTGAEIANVMNAVNEDGSAIFSEDDKVRFRNLYKENKENALAEAKKELAHRIGE